MTARSAIFVISLVRAVERREAVFGAFSALDLEFEFVDAVDGRSLSEEHRRRYSNWRSLFEMGRAMGCGMLGCSLSHLGVYERMSREGISSAAVFEDDVEPGPDLPRVLAAVDRLPHDWQVVTLHSLFASSNPRPVDAPPIVDGYQVCTYDRVPFGTQGYLISLAGARRALEVAYPVALPPDELLFRRRPAALRVYGIEPSVLAHREVESEIHALAEPVTPDSALRRPFDRLVVLAGKVNHRVRAAAGSLRTARPRTRA